MENNLQNIDIQPLAQEVSALIEQGKGHVAQTISHTMTALYWQVGRRIQDELLHNERAGYGKQVVKILSDHLTVHYGTGWSEKQLRHCIRFAEVYSDVAILSTVWRELTWSHFKLVMYIDDPLKREFYLQMAQLEQWSVRTLQDHPVYVVA